MGLARRLRFFWRNSIRQAWIHPWARHDRRGTAARILRWQTLGRLRRGPRAMRWIGDARLLCAHGMHGLTGNIYYGLAEFPDMAFVLHLLRAGEGFADIGANAGSYTVLAGKVVGARVHAVEPDAEALEALAGNIALNRIGGSVTVHPVALAEHNGTLRFTKGRGTMNRAAGSGEGGVVAVSARRADELLAGQAVVACKIDVEGGEEGVLAGAGGLLTEPQLLAIEIETVSDASRALLKNAGFAERWYDPFARTLVRADPHLEAPNRLFVREGGIGLIAQRLRDAPRIRYGRLEI